LLAPVGPTRGIAYAKINDAYTLANRLPLNQFGQATIDLYAPQPQPQRHIVIADGLPDQVHDLEIDVTGEHNPLSAGPGVGLDAIVVTRARPITPLVALGAAWLGSLLALFWAARAWIVGG